MSQVIIHKGRTSVLTIKLPYDISDDAITSQIRQGRNVTSQLIAEWVVEFQTDGTDGKLRLTLDDTVTAGIDELTGYMDLKRITGGEPVAVFDDPISVVFKRVVTE